MVAAARSNRRVGDHTPVLKDEIAIPTFAESEVLHKLFLKYRDLVADFQPALRIGAVDTDGNGYN